MRISIVSDYYDPQFDGIAEQVHGQATALAGREHEVIVISPSPAVTPPAVDGADVPRREFDLVRAGTALPAYSNGAESPVSVAPRIRAGLRTILASGRFGLVHVHNPSGVALSMLAVSMGRSARVDATLRSLVPEGDRPLGSARRALHHVLRRLDAVVAVSDAVIASIGPPFPGVHLRPVPNGVVTRFFRAGVPLEHLTDRPDVVLVDRIEPRNGLRILIRASSLLHAVHLDVRLLVAGDGPLCPAVERRATAEARHRTMSTEGMDRLCPRFVASANVLRPPCAVASLGMVLLEGMSEELPVAASRIPGYQEVVQEGADGDGRATGRRLRIRRGARAPSRRPPAWPSHGIGRPIRARERYSWRVVADRLEALYGGSSPGARVAGRAGGQVPHLDRLVVSPDVPRAPADPTRRNPVRRSTVRTRLALVAMVAVAVAGAAGCGSSGGRASSGGAAPTGTTASVAVRSHPPLAPSGRAPAPVATEASPPGDIPDSQVFVTFAPPGGGISVRVPEGWARTTSAQVSSFTDKLNTVRVERIRAARRPSVASVRTVDVPRLARTVPGFRLVDVSAVVRPAGRGVLVRYVAWSTPDPVTGKRYRDAVERYAFAHRGTEVILTLSGPRGADNVDPWNTVTRSLRWNR